MQTECDLDSLKILYQDDDLVAIHKPAGLLVHRSPIDKHETQFAVQITRDTIGQQVYPIHRLDKATSGLLLFALSSESARLLSEQLQAHQIQKTYHAIVRGWSCNGVIDKDLIYRKDKYGDQGKQSDQSQTAVTEYQTIAQTQLNKPLGKFPSQRYSLLKLSPKTGRKHQIRRHLNHISHPIIGDVKYGDRHHNHLFNDWLGYHRLYLAATSLEFKHPKTQQALKIESELQNDFAMTLNSLNLPDIKEAL